MSTLFQERYLSPFDLLFKDFFKSDLNFQPAEAQGRNYINRGIAKRSFNLGYKIASKFDLSKAEAMMENGLLGVRIPFAEEAKPKSIKIK